MSRPSVVLIAAAALAVLGVVGYFGVTWGYRNVVWIHDLVVALLGPPARQSREAYSASGSAASVDHSIWDALLKAHVDDGGWVSYEGFQGDVYRLDDYLQVIEQAPYAELGRDERLALLLNAYNAFTVELVKDHLPLRSIRDIPSRQRWKARRISLGGREWSLNELEHDEIRVHFEEPRVHFALVCAAVGCPPLRREAYVAERLEEQLEEQARLVHGDPAWVVFDRREGRLELTDLYSWYRGDFEQADGSIVEYAAPYVPGLRQALNAGEGVTVGWIRYDWQLNSVENRGVR